jgi:hypothetical protein
MINIMEEETEEFDDGEEADDEVAGVAKKVNDRGVCMICSKDYAVTGGNTSVIRTHILQQGSAEVNAHLLSQSIRGVSLVLIHFLCTYECYGAVLFWRASGDVYVP